MRYGAVILAAGRSSRLAPANKLLLSLGNRPVVRHVALAALASGLDPVIAVTGQDREGIAAALTGLPVRVVDNRDYAQGLASSLRAGVAALAAEADAALVLLGDMPLIVPRHLQLLTDALARGKRYSIGIPTYAGRRGNPVLWSAEHFPRLLELNGDRGASVLFRELSDRILEVAMPDDAVLIDIDTEAAMETVRIRFEQAETPRSDHPQAAPTLSAS